MLSCLRVRNLAIIDELELALGPGLTVITGETGAGKSILVGALHLVLGARARPDVVRAGAAQAEVEALFSVEPARLAARLSALDLPAEDEVLVRRVVPAQGKSRASVNGRLATASQLQALAAGLVDLCSQHEHHTLVDPATHLGHLDRYGALEGERARLEAAHEQAMAARLALDEAERALREREERQELLRFQLAELQRLRPRPGEDEELRVEQQRLANAERLMVAGRAAEHRLYSGDGAICGQLDRLGQDLLQLQRLDPSLATLSERVAAAATELHELARDLGAWLYGLRAEPERLAAIEERLHALRGLARRFGGSLEAAIAHGQRAEAELAALGELDDRVEALRAELGEALEAAAALARAISTRRQALGAELGPRISGELAGLGMGEARVRVEVSPAGAARPGELEVQGCRLGPSGIDRVEFLIAPNPGEEPKPLWRVASGGELSRALLALKCVLPGVDPDGLYVFDEVDSGVGGAVAEVIARKLRELSRQHQVLCITHLPQVAAYADQHLRVEKAVEGGRTRSRIVPLDASTRREELARMLGGIEITAGSRAAADALLQAAR